MVRFGRIFRKTYGNINPIPPKILDRKLSLEERRVKAHREWDSYDERTRLVVLQASKVNDNTASYWSQLKPNTRRKIINYYGSYIYRLNPFGEGKKYRR